jgi:2-polyprenyl-3-methyl-5-hydroxy-6-metoxy-1,4-benzoquinol methylase
MKNWNEKVQELYLTNEYFVKRESSKEPSPDYWFDGKKDPDGKSRNVFLEEEKKQYISENQYIIDFINGRQPGEILDIGCGPGYLLSQISDDWNKFGSDTSINAAEFASQYGTIHCAVVEDLELAQNRFGIIVSLHVIEHTENPQRFLDEIKKLLTKSGILIIATPDFDSGCARKYGDKYRMLHDQTHVSLFSNDSMHRFLRDNGFSIFKVEYPYFKMDRFFNKETLANLLNGNLSISPPFYGNFMTFFCVNTNS